MEKKEGQKSRGTIPLISTRIAEPRIARLVVSLFASHSTSSFHRLQPSLHKNPMLTLFLGCLLPAVLTA